MAEPPLVSTSDCDWGYSLLMSCDISCYCDTEDTVQHLMSHTIFRNTVKIYAADVSSLGGRLYSA